MIALEVSDDIKSYKSPQEQITRLEEILADFQQQQRELGELTTKNKKQHRQAESQLSRINAAITFTKLHETQERIWVRRNGKAGEISEIRIYRAFPEIWVQWYGSIVSIPESPDLLELITKETYNEICNPVADSLKELQIGSRFNLDGIEYETESIQGEYTTFFPVDGGRSAWEKTDDLLQKISDVKSIPSSTCPKCRRRLHFPEGRADCCSQWLITIPWNEKDQWNDEPLDPDDMWCVGQRIQWKKGLQQKGIVQGLDRRELLGGKLNYLVVRWDNAASNVIIAPEDLWRLPDEIEKIEAPKETGVLNIPISFGYTCDRLLQGLKTVTRRKWKDSHAKHFIKAFEQGLKVPALDKDKRYKGRQVGWLRLTEKPYKTPDLTDIDNAELAAEGFPDCGLHQFLTEFFDGEINQEVWVVRFEFEPLIVEENNMIAAIEEAVEVLGIPQEIIIDEEFKALIPPLSKDERNQLEDNLLTYGCRDPLVVWKHHSILLDGHNRHEICTRLDVEFKTVEVDLGSREDALNWLIDNQLGRRNLTPESVSYLRGKRYQAEKSVGHGSKSERQSGGQNVKTAERLADQYKVGSRTIERDAQFASAVDKVAEVLGDDVRQELLSRDTNISKKETLELAKIAAKEGEEDAKAFLQLAKNKALKKLPYKWGDRVTVTQGEFAGQSGSVTGSASADSATVQLDGDGGRESVSLEWLKPEPLARVENDFYPTAKALTERLIAEVEIKGQVIEPCAGDGAISSLFDNSISNDLHHYPNFDPDYALDATDPEAWEHWASEGYDWCVTNPPFVEASKILPLAWQHAEKGVAMLLRLSYLEPCSDRADWLKEYADNLTNVIIFNPRPRFREGISGSDNVTVAWLVWRKEWSWERSGVQCPFSFATGWS